MATWQDEFHRRCRRLLGVTDDSIPVYIDANTDPFWGCDTCGYGAVVTIEVGIGGSSKTYRDLGDLIRDLDDLPD